MGVVLFFLLALGAAGIIVYPLLPGRSQGQTETLVTDGDIDRAVRHLRRARSAGDHTCPACGKAHQPGDQFCVRCGAALPEIQVPPAGPMCPSCGAAIHESDRFCAKCGHAMAAHQEAA